MDDPVAKKPKLEDCIAEESGRRAVSETVLECGKISAEDVSLKGDEGNKKPVQECDVGITEFISKHEGFHGIIKQR